MAAGKAVQSVLKLSPVLDLNEASTLHSKLSELRGGSIDIDASDVERMGVQCVQVLVAGINAWKAEGTDISVTNVSDAFDKTLKLVGVDLEMLLQKETK